MKTVFGWLVLFIIFLLFRVNVVMAATNYGEGTYGTGNYNVGEVPVATSVPTTTNNSNVNSSENGRPTEFCNDTVTNVTPDLFEIRTTYNQATIYFSPPSGQYDSFYIDYSRKQDNWEYGVKFDQPHVDGVLSYSINELQSNTTYYFKIRSANGCAVGSSGNVMSARTTRTRSQKKTTFKDSRINLIQVASKVIAKIKNDKMIQTVIPAVVKPVVNEIIAPTTTPASKKIKFCFLWWCL